ncbi:MAG: BamA/TamA family outer membrane protein, partial [Saprospiraceae bacterium]|nr:BamA/TamA family outer membrane protein [Saprospiraceae bacterium]
MSDIINIKKKAASSLNLGLLLAVLFIASACNSTKYLAGDEQLLVKNSIKLLNPKSLKNKTSLKYELASLYKQKPNTSFLFFFPREWFYFATLAPGDTTKIDRWQQRVIAEPPAIYQAYLADSTARSMEYYLQYNGYYSAKVFYDDVLSGKNEKKINITYYVNAGHQVKIDSVFYKSQDTSIHKVLQDISTQTLLKRGEPLTRTIYEEEKERVASYLRNHGYADLFANYIAPIDADTTFHPGEGKANVYFEVLPPAKDSLHKVFRVGQVTIYTQYDPLIEEGVLQDTIIKGYQFKIPANSSFKIRPSVVVESIHLRTGDVFSQANYDLTIRQLSALGVYRFVRIQEESDPNAPGVINFSIELTRNPRMEMGIDFELNYTNRSATSGAGNLIGVFISPNLRNRNLFRGAELLLTNISAGVEINPKFGDTLSNVFNTIDIRAQADLYFPKFYDYLGVWKGLYSARISKKGGLISDNYYRLLTENAQTRLTASYNYLLLLGFYRYNLLNAFYGYDMQNIDPRGTKRYIVNHIGVDFLRPVLQEGFKEIIEANKFLERSFGRQLFVSLLFRDFSYSHNSRVNRFGNSHYFGMNVELAGAEVWAGNAIYNAFALRSDTLRLGIGTETIDFSQYAKLETDLRFYKQFNPKSSFATRISFGIARPFGFTTDVPYVKQFYVGGPNSIRAWAVRGLGPGGHLDTVSQEGRNRLLFYQTGDLKLEFSAEYRFNIFWRLNGALFLDGGNIWTLRRDASRPGSQFLFASKSLENNNLPYLVNDAFLKQIALGAGFGFRFDMTYFIFRLDAGLRMRSPYPLPENL